MNKDGLGLPGSATAGRWRVLSPMVLSVISASGLLCGGLLVWVGRSVRVDDQATSGWIATVGGFVVGVLGVVLASYTLHLTMRLRRVDAVASAARGRSAVIVDLPVHLSADITTSHRPSALLLADRAVVKFRGRGADLELLRQWALSDGSGVFFVLSGPSFVGKTRLVNEFVASLPDGWLSGRLRSGHEREAVEAVLAVPGRHVVVVEMGEAHPHLATFLADAAAASTPRLRVVLVCRPATPTLPPGLSESTLAMLQPPPHQLDMAAHGCHDDQARWYREAVEAFAASLGLAPVPCGAAPKTSTPIGLLHVAALSHVLVTSGLAAEHDDLETALAGQETRQWPPFPIAAVDPLLSRRCVAAVVLRQARERAALVAALRRVPALVGCSEQQIREVTDWLTSLYPGDGKAVFQAPLQVVAQALILPALDDEFVNALAEDCPPLELALLVGSLLGMFGHPAAQVALTSVLAGLDSFPDPAPLRLALAQTRGESAADHVLAALITTHPPTLDEVTALLDDMLDRPDLPHAQLAARRVRVTLLRAHGTDSELAAALHNLGVNLWSLGRHQEALTLHEEAVGLYRELAATTPQRYTGDLAAALHNLGNDLWSLGRHQEALTLHEEAVGLYRELAATTPQRYTGDLAAALHNLGANLGSLGRHQEALTLHEEAVGLCRELAATTPQRYTGDLAAALRNLGANLSSLGRHQEALTLDEEAVGLCRELAATTPQRYTGDLAAALHNLGVDLWSLGRHQEALTLHEEAVGLYRELAATTPQRYTGDLAAALRNLGANLGSLGRHQEASTLHEEAVGLYRELAATTPQRYTGNLADALRNLGNDLWSLGRHQEALTLDEEAVGLCRELAATTPQRYTGDLAAALRNLGNDLWSLGRHQEALTLDEEAVGLYRELAATTPQRYTDHLAAALRNLGNDLWSLGRHQEALTLHEEAVGLYRELAATSPERYKGELATALTRMRKRLRALGRDDEAIAAYVKHRLETTKDGTGPNNA